MFLLSGAVSGLSLLKGIRTCAGFAGGVAGQ